MVTVAFVTQHYPPESSANASRISDFARYLKANGVSVIVVAPIASLPFGDTNRRLRPVSHRNDDGVWVVNLWTWQPLGPNPHLISRLAFYGIFLANAALWCLAHGRELDVVVTSTPPLTTSIAGILTRKLRAGRWILDYRDHWLLAASQLGLIRPGGIVERLGKTVEAYSLHHCDRIFVVHEAMVPALEAKYAKSLATRVTRVPNCVDTSHFKPLPAAKKAQIIYAGNLGLAHDLETLVMAMKYVDARYNLRLLLLGDGEARTQLERVIRANGLAGKVVIQPAVSRQLLPSILAESIIGVDAIRERSALDCAIPVKFLEYLACGIPFVGSGGTALRAFAEASGGGVVTDGNPVAIGRAIEVLAGDPRMRTSLGAHGREYVQEFYETSEIGRRVLRAIAGIAGEAHES